MSTPVQNDDPHPLPFAPRRQSVFSFIVPNRIEGHTSGEQNAVAEYDGRTLSTGTNSCSIARYTILDGECESCRSSRWTYVPHQFGSLTSKVLGKVAHAVVDPILDRQKMRTLQPVLDRALSLATKWDWNLEMSMRLSSKEDDNTGQILEALR